MSGGRGGRRRSPIWEHFLLGKNADGNRVAQCTFCSRVMKSQPDRMENHFLKLCAQVDMDARRRWLLDRENRETISALQRQRDEALGKLEDTMSTNNSNSVLSLSGADDDTAGGSLQAQVVAAAAAGDTHSRQQQQLFKIAEVAVDHVLDDPELSTASPVPTKVRKMAAGKAGGSAAKKQQQQLIPQQQQQQQQRNNGRNPHFSILKDVNGKTERVELENLGLMRAAEAGGLDAQMLELQKRKLEIEERKSHLQIESMRYDNDIKRIKVAEENMLARKRLRDAGVPLEEIDLLLPLQKPEVVDFQSL